MGYLNALWKIKMKSSDNNERFGRNERYLNLEILKPPTAPIISYSGYHIEKNITIIEGRAYDFYCTSAGKPSPQINWKVLNSTIEQDLLHIGNVSGLHRTTITCCATNHMIPTIGVPEHGLECTQLNVNVLYKPTFVFNSKYDVKENDSFNITCTQQNINMVVAWIRLGYNNWSETHNTIKWTEVRRENAGTYTCKLRYSITDSFQHSMSGDLELSSYLNVEYPASVITFEAMGHNDSIFLNENESVIFRCYATGNPSPNIRIINTNGIHKQRNGHSLRYRENMTCAHTGKYSCYVKNIVNEDESKSKDIEIIVKCSPRPASNMSLDFNTTTTLYSTVILNFTVMAYPVPHPSDYVWHKCDDEDSNRTLACFPLVEGGHYNISIVNLTSHLTISDFTQHDIGRYMLSVGNGIGDAWNQTFIVKIRGIKPDAPQLFYEITTPNSAILTTIAGYDGGVSQAITLLYKNIQSTEWIEVDMKIDVQTNQTFSYTLTSLDSEINYEALAYASNDIGNSTVVSVEFTTTTYTTSKHVYFVAASLVGGLLVCGASVVCALKLQRMCVADRTNSGDIHTPGAAEGNAMYIHAVYRDARNVSGVNALTPLPGTSERELQSTFSANNLYSTISEESDNAYANVYYEFEA